MSKRKLGNLLAGVLPKDVKVNVRHLSTPPTRCEAIFSAPPGQDPETTFCETHFLVVTINRNEQIEEEIAIFGIEIVIYTTGSLTILFVSKADSTGCLQLLNVAPKTSLLRLISTTFLSYLVQTHHRPGVRLVLSLFARAQNQYLFPGSVDNTGKHVLDDRGLIKWWCRTVDPILREYSFESQQTEGKGLLDESIETVRSSATAYLLVPGCDKYETRAFFPSTARSDDRNHPRWLASYPLHQICKHPDAPPRCLVPRFPDDPKARFLIDLDDELPEVSEVENSPQNDASGQWRSIKSLDQFWEMMSFRQECSSGRLVGFLWLVINPPGLLNTDDLSKQTQVSCDTKNSNSTTWSSTKAAGNQRSQSESASSTVQAPGTPLEIRDDVKANDNPFFWTEDGRGEIVLSDTEYKSANNVLLEQDFGNEEVAIAGTMAWIRKAASCADILWWGQPITGKRDIPETDLKLLAAENSMARGLIVRKRKESHVTSNESETDTSATKSEKEGDMQSIPKEQTDLPTKTHPAGVNVLNASFIRKKKKT